MVMMKRAKEAGLDIGAARSPEAVAATTFADWCTTTLKSAVD